MIEVSAERLLEIGRELADTGERWHNHVLSPDCKLNERQQCALIVEASDRAEVYVTYSDEPMMDVGRAIATMVHGEDPLAAAGSEANADVQADSAAFGIDQDQFIHRHPNRGAHIHTPDQLRRSRAGEEQALIKNP